MTVSGLRRNGVKRKTGGRTARQTPVADFTANSGTSTGEAASSVVGTSHSTRAQGSSANVRTGSVATTLPARSRNRPTTRQGPLTAVGGRSASKRWTVPGTVSRR